VKSLRTRLLLFITFLLVFPFFLRRRPRVERRITILAPPSTIFPFLNDLRNWPLWTVWDRREAIDYEYGPVTAGDGAEQRWASRHMSGVLRIVKSERDERVDYELEMGEDTYQLVGRIEIAPGWRMHAAHLEMRLGPRGKSLPPLFRPADAMDDAPRLRRGAGEP